MGGGPNRLGPGLKVGVIKGVPIELAAKDPAVRRSPQAVKIERRALDQLDHPRNGPIERTAVPLLDLCPNLCAPTEDRSVPTTGPDGRRPDAPVESGCGETGATLVIRSAADGSGQRQQRNTSWGPSKVKTPPAPASRRARARDRSHQWARTGRSRPICVPGIAARAHRDRRFQVRPSRLIRPVVRLGAARAPWGRGIRRIGDQGGLRRIGGGTPSWPRAT